MTSLPCQLQRRSIRWEQEKTRLILLSCSAAMGWTRCEMINTTAQQKTFVIKDLADVVSARRYGMDSAVALGFHLAEATKFAVVISELGRNIERYAKTGVVTIMSQGGPDPFIGVVAEDEGPGIADVARVLAGGYTTSKGMGLGLSGSKNLMDEFELTTSVGMGTTVRAVKYLKHRK